MSLLWQFCISDWHAFAGSPSALQTWIFYWSAITRVHLPNLTPLLSWVSSILLDPYPFLQYETSSIAAIRRETRKKEEMAGSPLISLTRCSLLRLLRLSSCGDNNFPSECVHYDQGTCAIAKCQCCFICQASACLALNNPVDCSPVLSSPQQRTPALNNAHPRQLSLALDNAFLPFHPCTIGWACDCCRRKAANTA